MDLYQAITLGIIQGLTEFLPVSSSGHLVLMQHLLPNFEQPGVLFDVTVHLGTAMAVIIYFRRQIPKISTKFLQLLMIGTIPAAVAGLAFHDFFESLFSLPKLVGVALLATALMNLVIHFKSTGQKSNTTLTRRGALFVGLFQALAIIPGISRSGATICAGVVAGAKRQDAAFFSLMLSLPAIFGATLMQLLNVTDTEWQTVTIKIYLAGLVTAGVVGYLAIRILIHMLNQNTFKYFALYCYLVGILALAIF